VSRFVFLALLVLTGCAPGQMGALTAFWARLFSKPQPAVTANIKYVVGSGYKLGGVWYYPRESFSYDMTGVAEVMRGAHEPLTTDGEVFDETAMAGAHQTLQLPAIVRVTNLANGRQAEVRLNDRGPERQSRMLAVTPRVAVLLGFDPNGTAPVRVEVEPVPSQALAHQLNGAGSRLDVQTAPVGAVQEAALPPPPGAHGSQAERAVGTNHEAVLDSSEESVPLRLPETVTVVPVSATMLWIDAGNFGQAQYARQRATQLSGAGARVGIVPGSGQTRYTVRIGPIDNVAKADSLMQQVVRDGISDARVVVELGER
jgi:rare lipoprotein A